MDMHPHEQSLCTCSVASLHMRSINLLLDIPRIYGNMGMSADRIFISPALALTKIRLCVLGMQFSRYDAARKTSRLVNTAGVEPASQSPFGRVLHLYKYGLEWTRTTDLTLIRRAL